MNHIYRSIWNESTGTVVAVSEHAKRGGKKTSRGRNAVVSSGFILKSLASIVALTSASASYASPTGGTVVAGNASITTAPGNTTINQTTQNVSINWQTFDIGVGEAVKFVQPNSSAVALNRVLGADPSRILGNLSANGKVFLVNPNGVLFGTGAQVNVGGLVASTRNITDSDFMAGRYAFSGTSNGSVVNQGSINADGGYVALLGANVSNQGVIAARLGTVALAAGDALTLDVAGDGLLNVAVNTGSVNALVQNGGLIQANGGQVLLTAQSAGTLLQSAVNNTGMIQAQTISNHNGVIKLLGDMRNGAVNVGGTLDASAPDGGNGGFVDTSAAHVRVGSDAKITTAAARGLTGSWLIDPTDYTIAASGGDISGAALSSNLANTDITILSTSGGSGTLGSINVNDTVDWSANKLTLNAQNDININTAMNASGSASLALLYGQGAVAAGNTSTVNVNAPVNLPAGNNFSTRQGSDGSTVNYTVITSLGAPGSTTATDLQGMNGNMAGNYVLGASIDASTTSGWNAGAGFSPVVASEQVTESGEGEPYTYTRFLPFTGTFDGLGHTINGLTINQPTTSNAGLFGLIGQASTVRNVGLVGGAVTGSTYTGMLAGRNDGSISNSYATAVVTSSQDGARYVGGLVGRNTGAITNSYATGAVTSDQDNNLFTGGLVGSNAGAISNSYATGAVNGRRSVGGLAGENVSTGSISRSHATGAVTAGTYNSGGLVGSNDAGGTVSESYATGSVSGGKNVSGGLVGQNYGSVSTSYATGSVMNSEDYVGGLVGINGYTTGTIALSYSQGAVSGGDIYVGGLVGRNLGQAITSSYWDTDTSGQAGSAGGTGLTTVQMRTAANFAGFNFTTTLGASSNNWVMVDANGTLNNAGGAVGATRPMLASEYSTTI
ncbi:MAG TPA: filamentous hemagglutinin N-terminal domain-containing protein, partial [Steroidobacteraceae bacterium]